MSPGSRSGGVPWAHTAAAHCSLTVCPNGPEGWVKCRGQISLRGEKVDMYTYSRSSVKYCDVI